MKNKKNCVKEFISTVYRIDKPSKRMVDKFFIVLTELKDKEEKALRFRYGLDDNILRTCKEVGDELSLSSSRICQMTKRAIRKLRHPCRQKMVLGKKRERLREN